MIEVKNLSHTFYLGKKGNETTVPVLKDISFSVNEGEIITITGKSGSGKSTLLNLIGGFLRPSEGQIIMKGTDITTFNEGELADFRLENLSFIFQSFQLLPSMTAYENVELPLVLKGLDREQRRKKAMSALERVGLKDFESYYPSELSGGQQQRVSIARALVMESKIILADEPTGSLDSETEQEILAFIKELNEKEQITFLIITHDEEVAKIGHYRIHLHDGQIVKEGVSA